MGDVEIHAMDVWHVGLWEKYMSDQWFIDALGDLKAYAERTNMPVTAANLEDTMLIALAEAVSAKVRGVGAQIADDPEAASGNVTPLFENVAVPPGSTGRG
jgi:hypothetical protein